MTFIAVLQGEGFVMIVYTGSKNLEAKLKEEQRYYFGFNASGGWQFNHPGSVTISKAYTKEGYKIEIVTAQEYFKRKKKREEQK